MRFAAGNTGGVLPTAVTPFLIDGEHRQVLVPAVGGSPHLSACKEV